MDSESGGELSVSDVTSAVEATAKESQTQTTNDTEQQTVQGGEAQTATTTDAPAETITPKAGEDWQAKYGELEQRYKESSRQGREAATLRQKVQEYEAKLKQYEAPAANAQQAQAKQDFFGFPDERAYAEAFAKDPRGTMEKLLDAALSKRLDERLKPITEREQKLAFESQREDVFKRYPELAPGKEWHDATATYLDSNPELRTFLESGMNHPGINAVEVAGKLATYDLLKARLDALEGKKAQQRQAAATARPGTGAKTAQNPKDLAEGIQAEATRFNVDPATADVLIKDAKRALSR
jgi:hypothetical protein